MIITSRKCFNILKRNMVWFSEKPRPGYFSLTIYKQTKFSQYIKGLYKTDFYSKIIDLTRPIEDINSEIDKTTLYEIRRATKDGSVFNISSNINEFVMFYNDFANSKNLKSINESFFKPQDCFVLTEAILDNSVKVKHAYILDKEYSRARLLFSASRHLNTNLSSERAVIGRMNRYLHYQDILYFKNIGINEYDLGGFAFNTNDNELININKFKDSFGGKLVCEYDYWPWYYKYILNV